jgi:hypothetical protein
MVLVIAELLSPLLFCFGNFFHFFIHTWVF